jgi:hypothetical protein
MFENQYINLFTTHLAWTLGARGVPMVMATNLLQQGPLDASLGDMHVGLEDRVYFLEFKSEDTTAKYGGALQAEFNKGTAGTDIRSRMRYQLRRIWDHANKGNAAAVALRDVARRGWWFASGERATGASPNLDFISYEKTLFRPGALGLGVLPFFGNVQNFVDQMLQSPPSIGMTKSEAIDLLNALFVELPVKTQSADLVELLVVTLPSNGPAGPLGTALWSFDTVQNYFAAANVPKQGP